MGDDAAHVRQSNRDQKDQLIWMRYDGLATAYYNCMRRIQLLLPNDERQRWEPAAGDARIAADLNGWLPSAARFGSVFILWVNHAHEVLRKTTLVHFIPPRLPLLFGFQILLA